MARHHRAAERARALPGRIHRGTGLGGSICAPSTDRPRRARNASQWIAFRQRVNTEAAPPPLPPSPKTAASTPSPSFLRPLSVIPAQAGTTHPSTRPFPNSSLPPGRREVRWGDGMQRARTSPRMSPGFLPASLSSCSAPRSRHSCAPFPSFLRRQEPTRPSTRPLPNSSLPPGRGRSGGGWNAASEDKGAGGRVGSCLRRNDGRSAEHDGSHHDQVRSDPRAPARGMGG